MQTPDSRAHYKDTHKTDPPISGSTNIAEQELANLLLPLECKGREKVSTWAQRVQLQYHSGVRHHTQYHKWFCSSSLMGPLAGPSGGVYPNSGFRNRGCLYNHSLLEWEAQLKRPCAAT